MESDNSSTILNLQVLESEFNLVMKQYEQAQMNFISSLQAQGVLTDDNVNCGEWAAREPSECTVNPNYMLSMCKKSCQKYLTTAQNKYVSLQGRTFWGTGGLKEGNVTSEDQCKALCSSDPLCSGATYNPDKAYCWTRSGKGDVAIGLGSDYALISEVAENATVMQELNERLTGLNQQIGDALNQVKPEVDKQMSEKNAKKDSLQVIYNQLLADRQNIDAMVKEYQMINQQYVDNSLYVVQANSSYTLWLIFALVIIFFTIKLMFFPNVDSAPIRIIFWAVIIVLFVIVTTRLNSAPGFFLWGVIIMMVILMQMKIVPSP